MIFHVLINFKKHNTSKKLYSDKLGPSKPQKIITNALEEISFFLIIHVFLTAAGLILPCFCSLVHANGVSSSTHFKYKFIAVCFSIFTQLETIQYI